MEYKTLRQIYEMTNGKAMIENSLGHRLELVEVRRDALLFDIHGTGMVMNADKTTWMLLKGRFPTIVEEVRTLPIGKL